MIKVMTIFGTRPEAIKMSPLIKELEQNHDIESLVCVTAQHREMLDTVLNYFEIDPDYDLDIMRSKQTLSGITNRSLEGIDKVIAETKPDMVLVHGDTTTSFAGSLAAFYNKVEIGHVEAGLRTYDKYSPFPEEINRQLTDILANLYFAPTDQAKQHLLTENKCANHIVVTGNTGIDALSNTVINDFKHDILNDVGNNRMILLTAHRKENLGEPMRHIFKAIKHIVEEFENIHVVYPVHMNPVIRNIADEILKDDPRIHLISPLNVFDFHNIVARSHIILTDSGGIQEEAPSLGIPVLVLRNTTERPEGVKAGTLRLVGTDTDQIYNNTRRLLIDDEDYMKMAKTSNPYGDGKSSQKIVKAIIQHFDNQPTLKEK